MIAIGMADEDMLDLLALGAESGREAMIDCEHFFDGFKANRDYALDCARTAYEAGARWVILCDTNGGTLPNEITEIVKAVLEVIPSERLGIHTHNDTENAVANTLAAVRAGARAMACMAKRIVSGTLTRPLRARPRRCDRPPS